MSNTKENHGDCSECHEESGRVYLNKKNLTIASGAFLALAYVAGLALTEPIISLALYVLSLLFGGIFVFRSALEGLLKQRFLNINFLVSIASLGAFAIGQYSEAAAVVFFFMLAEWVEEYGLEKSRKALELLVEKTPQTALRPDGTRIDVSEVKVGDVLVIRPGDLVPVDGKIKKGLASFDESAITGEAVAKDKTTGEAVFAGAMCQNGYAEFEATKDAAHSTFSKIVSLVEAAQKSRPSTQQFIDRFSKVYTPVVVGLAAVIAVFPPLLLHSAFEPWIYRALTLLVIACPCALVISTPIAIASAIGGAARKGVLVKGGKYLEVLSRVRAVIFDKTKTLTKGDLVVTDVIAFNGNTDAEILADAAGLERCTSHPLGESIIAYAEKQGIVAHEMERYENFAGKGGKGSCLVCNNTEHCIGNLKLVESQTGMPDVDMTQIKKMEEEGKTVVLITAGKQLKGVIALRDEVRPESAKVVDALRKMKIESILASGDNFYSANAVAEAVGIKQVKAPLLPEDKVTVVKELKKKYQTVAMVGDGVNDAPALASSDVGIAVGAGGTDVAIETADVTLMRDGIEEVPYGISLGKKTMQVVRQNIVASLVVKAGFIVAALFGFAHLEYAISADSGIALLVILNGLRLFQD